MLSERVFTSFVVSVVAFMVGGFGFAMWSNDSLMGGVQFARSAPVQLPISRMAHDAWMDAARMGAPVFRAEGGPVSLPPLPAGKAIVLSDGDYLFATDDVADVARWYGFLTYPLLNLSEFPAVRYVYEVESAELVTDADGRRVLVVSIHEARTGCELPSCDPMTQLPNYDRRYTVKPANIAVPFAGGKNA